MKKKVRIQPYKRSPYLGSHFDMRINPDFGSVDQGSYRSNADFDSEDSKETRNKEESGAGGMCDSAGGCGGPASMAMGLASKALGKKTQPIDAQTMAGYAKDKSPAGIAQYEAAKEFNAEVIRQDQERQNLIAQYMKEATAPVTQQDLALGDAARAEYARMIAKYGPDTANLTLAQAYAKYPQEVGTIMQTIAKAVPGLSGKSAAEVWAALPPAFKEMTLSDLQGAFPNSTWLDPNSPAKVGLAASSSLTPLLVLGAGVALGAVFLLSRKKGV